MWSPRSKIAKTVVVIEAIPEENTSPSSAPSKAATFLITETFLNKIRGYQKV
jgi:hypothetical protein